MDEEKLREQIADFIYTICEGRILPEFKTLKDTDKASYYKKADQILNLIKEAGYLPVEPVQQVNDKEAFAVAITRKEFLMLPMETRRRILERQAAAFMREGE